MLVSTRRQTALTRLTKEVAVQKLAFPVILMLVLLVFGGCKSKIPVAGPMERQGYVNDFAGVLTSAEAAELTGLLARYEQETCHTVVVVIVDSLHGESIQEFSGRIAREWEISLPPLNNGILVSLSMNEGSARVETGTAFEWLIKDGIADRALHEEMFPLFKEGRIGDGIKRGVNLLVGAARLIEIPAPLRPPVCREP